MITVKFDNGQDFTLDCLDLLRIIANIGRWSREEAEFLTVKSFSFSGGMSGTVNLRYSMEEFLVSEEFKSLLETKTLTSVTYNWSVPYYFACVNLNIKYTTVYYDSLTD